MELAAGTGLTSAAAGLVASQVVSTGTVHSNVSNSIPMLTLDTVYGTRCNLLVIVYCVTSRSGDQGLAMVHN